MAVDEIAELGVTRIRETPKVESEVVGLELALKATLELEQRRVLNVEQCEGTEVTIAQGVTDFAELACVDNPVHVASYGVDEGAKTK